jgi:ubiquinone/menaquinone biosynthesis C-methylase UbiE
MEVAEYEKMYKVEEGYWWWVGKREVVKSILNRLNLNFTNILDARCGTGLNSNCLKHYGSVIGLDFSKESIKFCKMHGYKSLIKANAEELPSKECAFSLIIALDILEHLDDSKVLKESYRVLKPNGYLILRVPAFASLWSKHDGALQHKRRYSKVQLVAVLNQNGFIVENSRYWDFFLFLPILIARLIKKCVHIKDQRITTDVKELPNIVNAFFILLLKIESFLILHVNLPSGISLICVGKVSK